MSMTDKKQFRIAFCKTAAELGLTPKQLLLMTKKSLTIDPSVLVKGPIQAALLLSGLSVGAGGLAGAGAGLIKHKLTDVAQGDVNEEKDRMIIDQFSQATQLLNDQRKRRQKQIAESGLM